MEWPEATGQIVISWRSWNTMAARKRRQYFSTDELMYFIHTTSLYFLSSTSFIYFCRHKRPSWWP
jgi:hypothetical protein